MTSSGTPKPRKTLAQWLRTVEQRVSEDRAVVRTASRAGSDEDRRDAAELKEVIARLPEIADQVKAGKRLSAEDLAFAKKWMAEVPGYE